MLWINFNKFVAISAKPENCENMKIRKCKQIHFCVAISTNLLKFQQHQNIAKTLKSENAKVATLLLLFQQICLNFNKIYAKLPAQIDA